mgnify:CR=1 FL=1
MSARAVDSGGNRTTRSSMVKEKDFDKKLDISEDASTEHSSNNIFLALAKTARTAAKAPPVATMKNGEAGKGKAHAESFCRT